MKGSSKQKNAQHAINAPDRALAGGKAQIGGQAEAFQRTLRESNRLIAEIEEILKRGAQTSGNKGATMIDVKFADGPATECGCDICRESKRLEDVQVFEVWSEEGTRFITDQAGQACEYASDLDRSVRVRTKRIPRVQFEAIKRSAL